MNQLIAPTINLVILIAILAYYLRTPLKEMVRTRHESLRDELARVRDLLSQSRSQYEEFSSKLKAIEAETTALKQQAAQDGQAAKHRMVVDAQRLANNVAADARAAADALFSELKGRLYVEMGARVLERAEALLRDRLTGEDRARIRKEFSNQVETVR